MRNVLLVTFVSSLFGIEGRRKIAPNDSQRTEVTHSHKSLRPDSTVLRIVFSGRNLLNEKHGPVVPNSCPRIRNCPASSNTQSSAWQRQQLSTSSHPHGPAEGGLQRWACAPRPVHPRITGSVFPGPHWASTLQFLLRVGSREGLPLIGVVSTQSLALQEHFLNFHGLNLYNENSQLFVIAAPHGTHVKTVIYLLYSFPVSEHCWTLHASQSFIHLLLIPHSSCSQPLSLS